MKKVTGIMLLALLAVTNTSFAAEYMSAEQVKAVFTNKTFDGVYLPKDKTFSVFEAPDGTHHVLRPSGKRDQGRTWEVNDEGQHCTTHPKSGKLRCSSVVDAGNGEYHKYNSDGEHTHTLTNFRDGNKLDSE